MKKENGITLIALVISIIVIIILAGVTINTLINNGIIDKAKTATQEYKNAQDYEETQIAKYTNDINSYVDGNRNFDIKNLELNYDSKIDIKDYTSSTNKYIVQSAGIVVIDATGRDNSSGSSKIVIGGIQIALTGDGQYGVAHNFNSYSQLVTKGTDIYFTISGNTSILNAYYIPFK